MAKAACQSASDLRGNTQGAPILVWDVNSLRFIAISKAQQPFDGAVGRLQLVEVVHLHRGRLENGASIRFVFLVIYR